MGTKNNPGKFDAYAKALQDEPTFTLLARDPDFFRLVKKWAKRRMKAIQCGERPASDRDMVVEAEQCAWDGQEWRRKNNGAWRKPQNTVTATKMGTKNNPGKFDAYAKALQDEPTFTLLARDPMFSKLVLEWADNRANDIHCGLRPESDQELVREAYSCADQAQKWRKHNNGAWRKPQNTVSATKIADLKIPDTFTVATNYERFIKADDVTAAIVGKALHIDKMTAQPIGECVNSAATISLPITELDAIIKDELEQAIVEVVRKAKARNRL